MEYRPVQPESTSSSLASAIFLHAARISATTELLDMVRLNADFARELTGADRCSLWLSDENTKELWTLIADQVGTLRIPLDQGLTGACLREGQILLVNDVKTDARFLADVDRHTGYSTKQVLCIPMRAHGQVIGVLQLINKPEGFTPLDADLASLLAHFAASAIHSERTRQEAAMARLLRHELDLAQEVQSRMLPQGQPFVTGLEVAAFCRPAQRVGGDYYDLLQIGGSRFAFTLGDVSGKGIAAAVMMASIQTLLRSLLLHSEDPLDTIVEAVSNALYQSSTANRYSTLFCGILDVVTGELVYVNAGHVSPLILRSWGELETLPGSNLPLGLIPASTFERHTATLSGGETLLVFSDGLSEVVNHAGEFWDEVTVGQVLLASGQEPLGQLPAVFMSAADQWACGAAQHDDMTMVLMRLEDRGATQQTPEEPRLYV